MDVVDSTRLYTCPFTTRNQAIKTLEKVGQAIKQASRDESDDQAFSLMIKFLIAVAGGSTGHTVVTTPCNITVWI